MVTDNNYVDLMKEKDEEALRHFMAKDGWIVKSIIYKSNLLLQEDRMECMNDVFFAVWNNIRKYDSARSQFSTWLAGVTKYCILNHLRKQNNLQYISLSDIWDITDEKQDAILSRTVEEKEAFRELLRPLSMEEQEIFMRLFWEEQDYEDISNDMNMKKSLLYTKVSRGKDKLRDWMRKKAKK